MENIKTTCETDEISISSGSNIQHIKSTIKELSVKIRKKHYNYSINEVIKEEDKESEEDKKREKTHRINIANDGEDKIIYKKKIKRSRSSDNFNLPMVNEIDEFKYNTNKKPGKKFHLIKLKNKFLPKKRKINKTINNIILEEPEKELEDINIKSKFGSISFNSNTLPFKKIIVDEISNEKKSLIDFSEKIEEIKECDNDDEEIKKKKLFNFNNKDLIIDEIRSLNSLKVKYNSNNQSIIKEELNE